jgi:hypothetical protein
VVAGVFDDVADVKGAGGVAGANVQLSRFATFFVHVNRFGGGLDFDPANILA